MGVETIGGPGITKSDLFVMPNLKTREGLAEVISFIETKGMPERLSSAAWATGGVRTAPAEENARTERWGRTDST